MTEDDQKVKDFLNSEEVVTLVEDKELFDYYFTVMDSIDGWTEYYNEPTKKVRYKYEEGMSLVSCLCEAIIDAPIMNVLSLFIEMDLFHQWFPNIASFEPIKEITPIRGLYSCR